MPKRASAIGVPVALLLFCAMAFQVCRSLSHQVGAATGSSGLSILTTEQLHLGEIHGTYRAFLKANGGMAPYTWSVSSGHLPAGLSPESGKGQISGTPTQGGTYSFTVIATDSSGATASKAFSLQVFEQPLDQYGGLVNKACPNGPRAHFYTEKIGNRWVFCTPAGHAFWMLGVFNVAGDDHIDDLGSSYTTRILAKYGSMDVWGTAQAARLKAWGFNTVAEYADYRTWNKLASVHILNCAVYSLTNRWSVGTNPVKSIFAGTNPTVYSTSRTFPDVYDPAFAAYIEGFLKSNVSGLAPMYSSPWIVGIATDDRDYLFGFGAGADLPAASPHPHLGWIALITNFQQTSNPALGVTYADTNVYTKLGLRDFLKAKYSTIAALNSAWGSNYTTWGDAGGWDGGTGFLDEAGKNPWVCRDPVSLNGCSSAIRADLDAFLYRFSSQYFRPYKAKINLYARGILVFGPATLNSDGVTRGPILQAAGEQVDVTQASFQVSQNASTVQQTLDFTAQYVGDHPLVSYEILEANPGSALWRYPNAGPPCSWCATTQAGKGQLYGNDLTTEFNLKVTSTGSQPIAGVKYWEFHDNWAEKGNYGLVSLSDNAYDGAEHRAAANYDSLGRPRGNEKQNYGDFVSRVLNTHLAIMRSLGAGK